MMQQGNLKSVPAIPAAWQTASLSAHWERGDRRLSDDDNFEGGRNWALIILFSAMLCLPLGLVVLAF